MSHNTCYGKFYFLYELNNYAKVIWGLDVLSPEEKNEVNDHVACLCSLKHKHLLQHKLAEIKDDILMIPIETIDESLSTKIQNRNGIAFQEEEILGWFAQLCSAIQFLHKKNMCHKLLVTKHVHLISNEIKLEYIGMEKLIFKIIHQLRIDHPNYEPPERIWDLKYTKEMDIWCLGIILYELCMLKRPFHNPGDGLNESDRKICEGKYEPIKGFSSEMGDLVSRLLKLNPKERPTIDDILKTKILEKYVPSEENGLDISSETNEDKSWLAKLQEWNQLDYYLKVRKLFRCCAEFRDKFLTKPF